MTSRQKIFIAFLLVFSVGIGICSWILFPPKQEAKASDVVLVIAGYTDGRHSVAADLVNSGLSLNFVVSNPGGTRDITGSEYCRGLSRPVKADRIWCMKPDPITTAGEAMAFREIAYAEEWSSATVVTGRTHARRVKTIFEHCTDLDVNVISTDVVDRKIVKAQILHELGAFVKFWLRDFC